MGNVADTAKQLTLHTIGPLRLIDPDGVNRTPKGKKACGVLALLALAPHYARPRAVLQDKLWSDRRPERGAGSLRQTLTEIRRALGPWRECLIADRVMVGLDQTRIHVVTLANAAEFWVTTLTGQHELFEGLDICDGEFEDWLRDQRSLFESELEMRRDRQTELISKQSDDATDISKLRILLHTQNPPPTSADGLIANALTDIIAKTIAETGSIEVLDYRGHPEAAGSEAHVDALSILAGVARSGEQTTWRLVIADPAAKRLVWSSAERQQGTVFDLDDPDVLRSLNQAADIALSTLLANPRREDQRATATRLAREGIRHLTRLGRANLETADKLFERAYELDPRGVYLAWRAYVRTYLIAERLYSCKETIVEEALAFLRRAAELEPHNSHVASFGAQVHTIVGRSYVAAYELAQRSIELNRANPMGWACLGIAECHLGRSKAGLAHTLTARKLVGSSPLRFQVDALACIAGAMAGDVDTAILCGESSHAMAPTFAPPLRYLSALYLLRGEREQSQAKVHSLQALEPDFSYDLLREKSYPAAGLRRSQLLDSLPVRQL